MTVHIHATSVRSEKLDNPELWNKGNSAEADLIFMSHPFCSRAGKIYTW